MVATPAIRPDTTHGLLGKPTPDLALRLCGTSKDGQVVRLAASKCTIGSAATCTLRLRAPGVAPVHCLILRGSRGMAVRTWSPDMSLNGNKFVDSPLISGDRLKIGPIELEVVESPAALAANNADTSRHEPVAETLFNQTVADHQAWLRERALLEKRLQQQISEVEDLRQALESVRRESEQSSELERQLADTEIQQLHEKVAQLDQQLRSDRANAEKTTLLKQQQWEIRATPAS